MNWAIEMYLREDIKSVFYDLHFGSPRYKLDEVIFYGEELVYLCS